jgi:hypothetical protein
MEHLIKFFFVELNILDIFFSTLVEYFNRALSSLLELTYYFGVELFGGCNQSIEINGRWLYTYGSLCSCPLFQCLRIR